jgi:hypothetical protein
MVQGVLCALTGRAAFSFRGNVHFLRRASPRAPGRPAGAAPSQAERGAAPLSLGLDRRRRLW